MRLTSPLLNASPRNHVLAYLLTEVFSDLVTEDVYDAEIAELRFSVYYAGDWLGVSAKGFTDKMGVLVERMMGKLVDVEVNEERFKEIVDQVSEVVDMNDEESRG